MDPAWVGIAAVPLLFFAGPVYRRVVHRRALRRLSIEGLAVVPNGLGLSGLRISRAGWDGELRFEDAPVWGGRPGHVRFSAALRRPARTENLQGPGAALEAMGAQVALEGDRGLEVSGPAPQDLPRFVELCVALAEAAA